jgi:hypothetical protein
VRDSVDVPRTERRSGDVVPVGDVPLSSHDTPNNGTGESYSNAGEVLRVKPS